MTRSSLRNGVVPLALALWLMASWWVVGSARAQGPHATVELSDCPRELGPAVEAALELELEIAAPEARAGVAAGTLRCALVCDETGITAIVVSGQERVEQRIEGEGRGISRRLALALAQLLDASIAVSPETAAPDSAEPETAAPPPETEASIALAEAISSEPLITRLRIAGGVWLGGEPLLVLGALELGVELAPTPNVAIVIGAAGALGALQVEGGTLDVRLLSGSASLRLGTPLGIVWIGGGPAVRGGAVLWTGTPTRATPAVGRELAGGWLGIGAVAALLVRLGDTPLRAGLEAEGGGIVFGSSALVLDAVAARVGGAWFELRAALDVALD